jgi:pimeloyl-ACP methyl ester carboxylesterase
VLGLPGRFRPQSANGLAAEWELRLGPDIYTVSVSGRSASARVGPSDLPGVTVVTDLETWLALDDGSLTGAQAFLARRLSVRGNLDLAVRLQILFTPHGRGRTALDVEQVEVDVDGTRLSAYVLGEGPPVVLLHGLGGSKISWLPALSALAPRYRLIVPDLPGHGESDKPRTDYTARYYARVTRLLMDALGAPRAVIAGNSLGGRVAIELALRAPDRVRALVLLSPAIPGFRVRYVMGFTRVVPSELGRIPFPLRERWMQLAVRRLFANPDALPEEGYLAAADEFIRVYRDAAARMAFFDSLRHLVTEPSKAFWGRVRRIRVPALVLWGTADRLVPVRLAPRLADALPEAELVILPEVGHVPQFEVPDDVNREVGRFLLGLADGGVW